MNKAYKKVCANKGAGGADGIGFLLYGTFKLSSFIIKLCVIIFLFVLQLFLILVHMGTPE